MNHAARLSEIVHAVEELEPDPRDIVSACYLTPGEGDPSSGPEGEK